MSFQGKTAVVTGGSRGIGRAIVQELARQGCNVAFTYRSNEEAAQSLVSECEALGVRVQAFNMDAADFEAAQTFIKDVKTQFGGIHFLVNNAGITRDKLILMMKEDDWDAVLDTNLKSVFNLSKAVAAILVRQKQGGSILNISSISGVVGMPGQTNYSASKAGMIGFTKALAKELASRDITVNALALGMIETDMTGALDAEYRAKVTEQIPLKRFGKVTEIARITAFLLSPDAAYITGQVIQADGGLAM
ncbi:MAG: 3-oxoacyl-[acyl-carrier-protein] reductase [Blastocatellia bacterium]|nr:3-oxoacyl-[acyl-carrier-protein] reductase [Blastocatellia bacterium]HNG96165.1 3-oxoacyl-[acyl-carrier-protein] reductase [Acidobacteriota bacterium]